ncbi:MAG: DUF1704 domain-containing protein [bacterium]|nr:DUF1704 domain-containing protein [bacterium]
MSLLESLIPLNLESEEAKFRQDQTYNPQFVYSRVFTPKLLTRNGLPRADYLALAEKYLQIVAPTLPKQAKIKALAPRRVSQITRDLFRQLGLNPPLIHWQKMLSVAKRKNETLIFAKNLPISESMLKGVLAHEVQTHLLRSHNQALQTLPRSLPSTYSRTEEGLASLNSKFVRQNFDFRTSCCRYLACNWSQKESFAQVFARLQTQMQFDFDRAWYFTLRAKRGLPDTSQPGGFTKDIVYWEGTLQVLDWLLEPENKLADLYLGKISLAQVPEYQQAARREDLIYPTFIAQQADYLDFLRSCKQQLAPLQP